MSATFAYEDPLTRASTQLAGAGTRAQTAYVFKEMGRNMWSSGKGFAKVGALYSGIDCCIEGVSLQFSYLNHKDSIAFAVSTGVTKDFR